MHRWCGCVVARPAQRCSQPPVYDACADHPLLCSPAPPFSSVWQAWRWEQTWRKRSPPTSTMITMQLVGLRLSFLVLFSVLLPPNEHYDCMQPVGLLCWLHVLACGVSDLLCAAGPRGVVADSGRGVLLAAGCISRRTSVTFPARSLAHSSPSSSLCLVQWGTTSRCSLAQTLTTPTPASTWRACGEAGRGAALFCGCSRLLGRAAWMDSTPARTWRACGESWCGASCTVKEMTYRW